MKLLLVFCIILLSYYFTDIDYQYKVMSGNISIVNVL
jgi:hypothetical protein